VTLIIAFLLTSQTVVADTLLLSDDFNDGNYDGWTVREGSFSAATYELVGTGVDPTINYITIPVAGLNTLIEGVWEFDLTLDSNEWTEVALFTQDAEYAQGRGVSLIFVDDLSGLGRHVGSGRGTALEIGVFSQVFGDGDWHFKVQLNESNHFYVWESDVLILDAASLVEDLTYGYFGFNAYEGSSIDNITINEVEVTTPGTTPPTETTTTTTEPTTPPPPPPAELPLELIAIGGGVAVLVIVLIIWKTRS
jgi:hypothetical protein